MTDLAVSATPRVAALNTIGSFLGRWRGLTMLVLAAGAGFVAALVVALVGWLTAALHGLLFLLPAHERLSEQPALATPVLAVIPVLGGAALAISIALARRFRTRRGRSRRRRSGSARR